VADRPEQVLRRGITLVPRDGVRVVQARAPVAGRAVQEGAPVG
jgi:hypothetical protein